MRRVQVDFNNMVGSVVPVPLRGEPYIVGEEVVVFDASTEDYSGRIVSVSATTVFIEVGDAPASL